MKDFIMKKLRESLRVPNDVELIGTEDDYKNINFNDIEIIDGPESNGIYHLYVKLPNEPEINEGIVLDIDLIGSGEDSLYLILNILLDFNLQRKGLGYKIHLKFINEFGNAFIRYDKVVNDEEMPRIWEKLKREPNFEVYESEIGKLCVLKTNPVKDDVIARFNSLTS